jgi:CubicO group peptidase (beta-lactamase class C family)
VTDSDDGFSILAQVVEKINGSLPLKCPLMKGQNLTFAEIVQRDILGPLGMNRSAYVVPTALKSEVVIPNNTLSALSVDIDFAVFNGYISSHIN